MNVREQDALFRYVCKGLFGVLPDREKGAALEQLKAAKVFLIDLKLDPVDGNDLPPHVPDLTRRCQNLVPRYIILIKASVYDAAFRRMSAASLPVVDGRIPFPGSGQQKRFEVAFTQAIDSIGWKTPVTGRI